MSDLQEPKLWTAELNEDIIKITPFRDWLYQQCLFVSIHPEEPGMVQAQHYEVNSYRHGLVD